MGERSLFRATVGVGLVCLVLLAGCGSNESVLLEAKVEAPSLAVTATVLTTEVAGSFAIGLSLGDLASDPTTVKLGTFSLERNDQVLLSPLKLETTPTFPISVDVGETKRVEVTIANPDEPPELADELCGAELEIRGTLTDSLGDDRPRTVTSLRFSPACTLLD
jgi:hypothetical protein